VSQSARVLPIVLIALLSCGVVFGQAVSQISGTTKDASGAVMPGVEVTATQTDTGIKRTATTDASGNYVLPNLPIGPYRLEAMKMGFRTYVQTGIELQVDSSPTIPVVMGVGDVAQAVQVEANAAQVETEKLGVGTVMESERVLDLPLNGRNATDLISLTPGAIQTGASTPYGMNTGVNIAVAGGQAYATNYALDGATHIDWYDATNMPFPFPDALQEFKVETSSQNATAGTHSGAQVNAVTKAGTNSFHGDAFEFFRNSDLNARNFFATAPDGLKRNQFGGVLGGPIRKNKIFFFGGYQGTELRQTPVSSISYVPTAAMLLGDFTAFASPACNTGKQVTLKAPFVNNQIPVSQINPAVLKLASFLPATPSPCGQTIYASPLSQYYWQVPVRGDYQYSEKQSIFIRYLVTKQNQVLPYTLSNNALTSSGNSTGDMSQSAAIGDTYLISATKVNSLRISMQRISGLHLGAQIFGPGTLGVNAFSYVPNAMQVSVTGGPTLGTGVGFEKPNDTFLTINDDLNWIRGSHQIVLGGSQAHTKVYTQGQVFSVGAYSFNGQTTGLGWADAFAGDLAKLQQSGPNGNNIENWFSTWYAQDTWKVNSRLTLTYGLRWEPYFPETSRNNKMYTFDLARFYAGTVSTVYTNAPPGFYYPGDPGFNGKQGMEIQWNNWEPRIGLAWDPFGDGKSSVRIGAGKAYDAQNEQIYSNPMNVAPFTGNTVVNGPVPFMNPWSTTPGGNPFPYTWKPPIGYFNAGDTFIPILVDQRTPSLYTWNVSLQRQFTPSWFASATYVGNHSQHLWANTEINPGVYIPGNCVAGQYGLTAPGPCSNTANVNNRRVLNLSNPVAAADIANLTQFDDGGTSMYNGLILATNWRASRDVSINANYTWSHCEGIAAVSGATPAAGSNYPHINNRDLDVGNCTFDHRSLFNLTVVARTPRFSNKAMNLAVSGWQVSAIYRYQSGAWMNILSGLDNAMDGFTSTERPNQVLTTTAATNQGQACANVAPCVSWLNPNAFAQPAIGTLGNLGAYNVLGPKFFQFDMALVREFRVRERMNMQFRAEAFNVLNNVRFNNPATTLSTTSTFGNITSAQDPRILQLAMKFIF